MLKSRFTWHNVPYALCLSRWSIEAFGPSLVFVEYSLINWTRQVFINFSWHGNKLLINIYLNNDFRMLNVSIGLHFLFFYFLQRLLSYCNNVNDMGLHSCHPHLSLSFEKEKKKKKTTSAHAQNKRTVGIPNWSNSGCENGR